MNKKTIKEIIELYDLQPLPEEGGYFRFVSEFGANAGLIYYLITEDSFSRLHSLTQDEAWFFLEGDALEQTVVHPDFKIERRLLGENNRISIVRGGCFQATRVKTLSSGYALTATVMSPRYEDSMYTHGAGVKELLAMEELKEII